MIENFERFFEVSKVISIDLCGARQSAASLEGFGLNLKLQLIEQDNALKIRAFSIDCSRPIQTRDVSRKHHIRLLVRLHGFVTASRIVHERITEGHKERSTLLGFGDLFADKLHLLHEACPKLRIATEFRGRIVVEAHEFSPVSTLGVELLKSGEGVVIAGLFPPENLKFV